ncbi:hypothetical protein BCEP4_240022 [Burkholderia cepacia]|nr:hypothetical protein BCEP4_240022 [Burkholderia cepacia]
MPARGQSRLYCPTLPGHGPAGAGRAARIGIRRARGAAAGEMPGVFIVPSGPIRPAERATQRNP